MVAGSESVRFERAQELLRLLRGLIGPADNEQELLVLKEIHPVLCTQIDRPKGDPVGDGLRAYFGPHWNGARKAGAEDWAKSAVGKLRPRLLRLKVNLKPIKRAMEPHLLRSGMKWSDKGDASFDIFRPVGNFLHPEIVRIREAERRRNEAAAAAKLSARQREAEEEQEASRRDNEDLAKSKAFKGEPTSGGSGRRRAEKTWLPEGYSLKQLKPRHPTYKEQSMEHFRKAIAARGEDVDGIRKIKKRKLYQLRSDVKPLLYPDSLTGPGPAG